MKNKLFVLMAFAAIFAGCSKEMAQVGTSEDGFSSFSITASLAGQNTKLSYTEQEDGSYKATFASTDQIKLFFVKSDKTVAQSATLAIDPYTISSDGRKAVFNVTRLAVPADYEKLVAYLTSSNASLAFKDSLGTVDLSSQTEAGDAAGRHIICGSLNKSELKTSEPGKLFADVKMDYRTSLLRFNFTLPEKPGTGSEIVLRSPAGKIHNKVSCVWGDIDATGSSAGEILVFPSKVDTTARTLTALACIWAGDDLSDLNVSVQIGDAYYGGSMDLAKTSLEAGKVYDVTRTLKLLANPINLWTKDDADSKAVTGGDGSRSGEWLSYSDGTLSWTENTTGKPRTETIILPSGSICTVTQLETKDFKGDYTFRAKYFGVNNTGLKGGNLNDKTVNLTAGNPIKDTTLVDCNAVSHTSCLGLVGFYDDTAVMDAAVDIQYSARVVTFSLLLDARTAQATTKSNVSGYNYVCFLPEMGTGTGSSWSSPWNFVQPDLDATNDFMWLEFTGAVDVTDEFTWNSFTQAKFMNGSLKTSANRVIGITCAVSNSPEPTSGSVYGTYNVIYQGNVNSTTTIPVTIKHM